MNMKSMHHLRSLSWGAILLLIIIAASANSTTEAPLNPDDEPHPDPNEENYPGMIYIGRHNHHDGKRTGFHTDNGIKYIYGTGFDETHREIEEKDLHHDHYGPDSEHDLADRAHGKTREQVLH